jgi:hypothetical protein
VDKKREIRDFLPKTDFFTEKLGIIQKKSLSLHNFVPLYEKGTV